MKPRFQFPLLATLTLWLLLPIGAALADDPPAPPPPAPGEMRRLDTPAPAPAADEAVESSDNDDDNAAAAPAPEAAVEPADKDASPPPPAPEPAPAKPAKNRAHHGDHHGDNARVTFGGNSTLGEGETADAVVSILGSSSSAGEVSQAVVSVLGNTRVTGGSVGDAAVAVLGNNYVDAHVQRDVVAVLGNVELGPNAVVDGQVVCVGGHVTRDPGAIVHGNVQNVSFFAGFGGMDWLHAWVEHCLVYGRPLAFAPHLGWAWTIALVMLGIYVLIALVAPGGVAKCVKTLEERPGHTILAALLVTLLTPIAFVILLITVVGAPALVLFLIGAAIFGKAAMLAWIGWRLLTLVKGGAAEKPAAALAVLVGGVLVMLLYTVPFLGFLLSKLLSWVGIGLVVYTLIQSMKRAKPAMPLVPPAPPTGSVAGMSTVPTPASAPTPAVGLAAVEPAIAGAAAAPESVSSATDVVPPVAETVPPAAAAAVPPLPAPAATMPPPLRASPTVSASTLPRAGFWIRILASLLDAILMGLVIAVLPHALRPNYLLLYGAYCAAMWSLKGTTIGGIVCGLKVVRLDERPVDWMTGIVRALGGFLSLCVAGIGFIWVAFDDDKQSWHDKIAGTTIVLVPKGVSLV